MKNFEIDLKVMTERKVLANFRPETLVLVVGGNNFIAFEQNMTSI